MRTTGRVLAVLSTAILMLVLVLAGAAPAAVTETLFGSAPPALSSYPDSASLTVGVVVTAKQAGTITNVRFYKGPSNDGTHIGAVYSSSGLLLTSATFAAESSTGWQSVQLASPVRLAADQSVTAVVFMPEGHYAVANPFTWPSQSTSLKAIRGVFKYGSRLSNPASTYGTANYFVDVSYVPGLTGANQGGGSAAPTGKPTSPTTAKPTATSPTASPTSASPTSSVTTSKPTASVPATAGKCVGAANTPGGADPWGGCWPGLQHRLSEGIAGRQSEPGHVDDLYWRDDNPILRSCHRLEGD